MKSIKMRLPWHSAQGLSIIFDCPVILTAVGIQSPFPHPTWLVLQECSSWDANLSTRRVLPGMTVLETISKLEVAIIPS